MKVRWTSRSVRLRITPTELATLERGETVTVSLIAPGGGWAVVVMPDVETGLAMRGSTLYFALSETDVKRLAALDVEGVYFQQTRASVTGDVSNANPIAEPAKQVEIQSMSFAEPVKQEPDGLRYYIEKDFPCEHPRAGEAGEPVTESFAPFVPKA